MSKLLSIATAGVLAEQSAGVGDSRFPRVDYVELPRLVDAETIDYSVYDRGFAGDVMRQIETQLRSDLYLTTLGWMRSRRNPLVFTWSERAGIPFAFYKRFFRSKVRFITMFQCWSDRQEAAVSMLGLFAAMDGIVVHCNSMKYNLLRLGVPEPKIHVIPYSIDQSFFSPIAGVNQRRELIVSIGEPRTRDYNSLFRAVDGLPVELKVAASGLWYARERANLPKSSVPDNVTILRHIPQTELRSFYASARFIVLPLVNLVYSAGATSALEAGSMGRAVIAYRSAGIVDYILDGETGILVEPGDESALRAAIQYLLANPGEAARLGQNARQRITEKLNLETYVCNLAELLRNNLPA
jgi:glycosyltransferase involved in cell wall biosynthesis